MLAALAIVAQYAVADDPGAKSRPIYRCKAADAVTFSDRPCDAAAEVYEAGARVNTYEAPDFAPRASIAPAVKARGRESDSEAKARAKLLERCERIQQSLRDIRSKMRSGYTAKEGERLRTRQTKLQNQRRAAKCR